MSEMKYFMRRSILKNEDTPKTVHWDYPMFIRFTSEEKDSIQRNYISGQIHGLGPDFRKICITNRCTEGFTYRELMEEIKKIPECSEEEYNLFADVPHWNPVEKMGLILEQYTEAVKAAEVQSRKDFDVEEADDLAAAVIEQACSDQKIPDASYTRES